MITNNFDGVAFWATFYKENNGATVTVKSECYVEILNN